MRLDSTQILACFLGAASLADGLLAAQVPEEIPTGLHHINPIPASARAEYEAPEYYSSFDGWVQSYPSPTCSVSKTCVQNGCETHALRWAWKDPREEPTWPANLRGCECEAGKPPYARCLYDVH